MSTLALNALKYDTMYTDPVRGLEHFTCSRDITREPLLLGRHEPEDFRLWTAVHCRSRMAVSDSLRECSQQKQMSDERNEVHRVP